MQQQEQRNDSNEGEPLKEKSERAKKRPEKEEEKHVRNNQKTMHNIQSLRYKRLEGSTIALLF